MAFGSCSWALLCSKQTHFQPTYFSQRNQRKTPFCPYFPVQNVVNCTRCQAFHATLFNSQCILSEKSASYRAIFLFLAESFWYGFLQADDFHRLDNSGNLYIMFFVLISPLDLGDILSRLEAAEMSMFAPKDTKDTEESN